MVFCVKDPCHAGDSASASPSLPAYQCLSAGMLARVVLTVQFCTTVQLIVTC